MPYAEQHAHCPSCGDEVEVEVFYEHLDVPIHSCVMVDTRQEALDFPTGDLRLALCPTCGFIWNVSFDPTCMRYSGSYEETQSFSPHFRKFQTELADRWISRYGLRNRRLLEIGCGKGDFLQEICSRGSNRGTGIDPSYRPDRSLNGNNVDTTFLRELYSTEHADIDTDFVCCRHTLEHIEQTLAFVELCRRQAVANNDAIVAFEVPDVRRVLQEQAFWDVYYEHCSYFSLGSLGRLFRSLNLEIIDLYTDYADQYLIVESRPAQADCREPHPAEETVSEIVGDVDAFRRGVADRLQYWHEFVAGHRADGKRVAVWGSGSKAVAFLSRLRLGDSISAVVDINPHRHRRFLAGTGHEILAPQSLQEIRPDVVIAMNPVYRDEIQHELKSMHLNVEVVAL